MVCQVNSIIARAFLMILISSEAIRLVSATFATEELLSPPLSHNFLSGIHGDDTLTEAVCVVSDSKDGFYVVGNILSGAQGLPILITDVPDDTFGGSDIFAARIAGNGSISWIRRTGTSREDWATNVVVDANGFLYVVGHVTGRLNDGGSGAVVLKFDSNGKRLWAQAYGSVAGRERLHAIAISANSSYAVLAGVAGPKSKLIQSLWPAGSDQSALILRIDLADGTLRGVGIASGLAGALSSTTESVVLRVINGSEKAFLCGSVAIDSTGRRNAALFKFTLPELYQDAAAYVESPRTEQFVGVATSVNEHSLYCAGTTTVSVYEETDARVTRFNTSDFQNGWTTTIGSIRFSSTSSIRYGTATEYGRDIAVDKMGNIYVLVQSTSRLAVFQESANQSVVEDEDTLRNMRSAIVILSPNGSVIGAIQSQMADEVTILSMELADPVVVVVGYVHNTELQTTQAIMNAAKIDESTRRSEGLEFVPPETDISANGGNEETEPVYGLPTWIFLVVTIGGIIFFIAFVSIVAIILRTALKQASSAD